MWGNLPVKVCPMPYVSSYLEMGSMGNVPFEKTSKTPKGV